MKDDICFFLSFYTSVSGVSKSKEDMCFKNTVGHLKEKKQSKMKIINLYKNICRFLFYILTQIYLRFKWPN